MAEYEEFTLPGIDDIMFHPWVTIKKFSEIDIEPNTIIFCDIDDTLIHHPILNGEWTMMLSIFFNMRQYVTTGKNDFAESAKATESYLDSVLAERPMLHTDKEGFFNMVNLAKRFVFVTARLPCTIEFTSQNLKSVDVDPENFEVRFSAGENKGEYIWREFGEILGEYDSVVFIDDQPRNLENVYSAIQHPNLKLYRFSREPPDPYTYYPLPPDFNPHLKFNGTMVIDARISTDDPLEI